MAKHIVKSNFKDKEDGKRQYIKDRDYPSPNTDYVPSDDRIAFLLDEGFIEKKQKDLSKLTKNKLLDLAEKEGVDASENDTKAEIIKKLEE